MSNKTISRPVPKARPLQTAHKPARIHPSPINKPLTASTAAVAALALEPEFAQAQGPLSISVPTPGFDDLALTLSEAFDQAAHGKGAARHGLGQPFAAQPMQQLIRLNGLGFATGQASKKASEALRMLASGNTSAEAAVNELLGAIVYLAAAVVAVRADVARPEAERVLTRV